MNEQINIDKKIINKKNTKYLRKNKIKRICFRIPTVVIFFIAFVFKEIGGYITGIIWFILSELIFSIINREDIAVDKLVKKGEYYFKEDIVKDIYYKDINSQEPSEGYFIYMSFINEKVAYSPENEIEKMMYDIGEKVYLQIVNYKGKNIIINVFKTENNN